MSHGSTGRAPDWTLLVCAFEPQCGKFLPRRTIHYSWLVSNHRLPSNRTNRPKPTAVPTTWFQLLGKGGRRGVQKYRLHKPGRLQTVYEPNAHTSSIVATHQVLPANSKDGYDRFVPCEVIHIFSMIGNAAYFGMCDSCSKTFFIARHWLHLAIENSGCDGASGPGQRSHCVGAARRPHPRQNMSLTPPVHACLPSLPSSLRLWSQLLIGQRTNSTREAHPLGPGVEGAEQDGARQEEMHCLRAALGGGAAGTRASRPRRLR